MQGTLPIMGRPFRYLVLICAVGLLRGFFALHCGYLCCFVLWVCAVLRCTYCAALRCGSYGICQVSRHSKPCARSLMNEVIQPLRTPHFFTSSAAQRRTSQDSPRLDTTLGYHGFTMFILSRGRENVH